MTTRSYKQPSTTLRIHFDPLTWDALKTRAAGQMERAAYLFIQQGLGLAMTPTGDPTTSAEPPPEKMEFGAFPPLRSPPGS